MSRQTHFRTCHLCEAMCGIAIDVEGDRVVSIRGDDDDPFSRGHICPKAPALADLHSDADRLRRPVRREGTRFVEVSWGEALAEAASRLHDVQTRHGRHALATYLGNPAVHNHGTVLYAPMLNRALRTRNRYSATSVDQLPHQLAAYLMFGHQLLFPIPDIDRTHHMILFGANPLASMGSLMTAPGVKARLAAIRARGGKVIVVDPRRTETADIADEHIFVRPGTDALVLLGMLQVILAERRPRLRALEPLVRGLDQTAAVAAEFIPERVADRTGVPADTIRRLALEYFDADPAVLYGRVGTSTQAFGGLCQWLINTINIVAGNFDRPGGAMFTTPAVDALAAAAGVGIGRGSYGRWKSRVRGLPEVGGELPVATLAEDILEPGDGQIRALLTIAGNPVLSTPNGAQFDRALSSLEYMVCLDHYINETTRHANLILPPTSPLERSHYDAALHLVAVRNTAKWSPPLFDPPAGTLHDWEIILELKGRIEKLRGGGARSALENGLLRRLGPDGLIAIGLRTGPYGLRKLTRSLSLLLRSLATVRGSFQGAPLRFAPRRAQPDGAPPLGGASLQGRHDPHLRSLSLGALKRQPHGVDLGPLQPSLPGRLPKDHRHIDLAPEKLVADVARLRATNGAHAGKMLLVGRRHLRSNNSWMHNVPKLVAGKPRCTLLVHPTDAARLGLADAADAVVTSRVGSVRVPVEVSDEIMQGVVSLPHGFGHGRDGVRLSVATKPEHAGVSVNDLTDERFVDELAGTTALNGVPVDVARA